MTLAIDITTLAQVTPRRPIPAQGAYGLGAVWASGDVAHTPFLRCFASCSKADNFCTTACADSPVGPVALMPFVRANPWLTNSSARLCPPTATKP
jgi:hypothetical protein